MSPFVWKDSFSIGNKELDSDHRKFLELLNDCYMGACDPGTGRIDPDLILRIKEFAAMHFSYEEEVMRSSGYPGFAQHEKQHRYFEEQVTELEQIHNRDGDQRFESMFSFLLDWFVNHILEEDMKFAPFIKNHGESIE